MLIKQRRRSTNPYLRSLLQKAIRRGHADLAATVATRLDQIGDRRWLRSRAVVLAYEECWPSTVDMALPPATASKVLWLRRLAGLKKQKDAAGLGTFAHALSEGDTTVLGDSPDERAVRVIATAIQRPGDFWHWATTEAKTQRSAAFVRQAKASISAPTWPWDKAFVMSAAYLALASDAPQASPGTLPDESFPFWCAIDKHTPAGKIALATVADALEVPRRQLTWASFYFESAVVHGLEHSPWWEAERRWRLKRAGLSVEQALELWARARPLFVAETETATADLIRETEPSRHAAALV